MKKLYADLLLFLTAILWGSTFVFQKKATNMYAFNFNTLRFFIAAIVMGIAYVLFSKKKSMHTVQKNTPQYAGIISGLLLALGINLQQVALIESSAGKAGFLTGLYVVFVPLLGIFLRHAITSIQWFSTILAVVGLYFMSLRDTFTLQTSDILLILGAVVWAGHILYIEHVSKHYNTFLLAIRQYFFCGLFSFIAGVLLYSYSFGTTFSPIHDFVQSLVLILQQAPHTWQPILYAAIISTSIGFSLQIYAQRYTSPMHTSLIISLEAVFAALFGALLLHETMSSRETIGAILIFIAMILSQMFFPKPATKNT